MSDTKTAPVPMILHCPECSERHVDAGEFATKEHHTHACQHCGFTWRPALVPTVGVRFLPGFKDAPRPDLTELRALVEKWRAVATWLKAQGTNNADLKAATLEHNANELEALIDKMEHSS